MMLIGAHLDRSHVEPVSAVRAIDIGEVVLSAAPIHAERGSSDPALLQSVLESRDALLDLATFIAIRWGSIVGSTDAARDKCGSRAGRWRERLEKTQGFVEMTFKTGGRERPGRPAIGSSSSGRDYLERLYQMRRGAEVDTTLLDRAEEVLGPFAVETRRIRRDDGGAEIALMIPRDRLQAVATAGRQLREERPESAFLLSGPWPLEVFADEQE